MVSTSPAFAQQQTFYLDRMFVAGAPDDGIALWRTRMEERTRLFGQLGLGFGYEPFRTENELSNSSRASRGNPVSYQFITYADAGIEFLKRFAFQVQVPVITGQKGNSTNDPNVPGATDAANPDALAVGDMRLDLRATLWESSDKNMRLGALGAFFVPIGGTTANVSYASDASVSGLVGLGFEHDMKGTILAANIGYHFRPDNHVNNFTVGSEVRYALGAFVPLRDGSIRVGGEIFGSFPTSTGTTGPAANMPLEWMAEGRYWFLEKRKAYAGAGAGTRLTPGYAPDFRLIALVGYTFGIEDTNPPSPARRFKATRYAEHGADTDHDKIPDDIDLCPTEPEDGKPPNPDDGCPAVADRDGDGIPDNIDKCPDQPEDFDGIQDEDGCPEDDADADGIPDEKDACPREPGEPDPDPKKNGCPKFIRRVSGSTEIQILKVIEFETAKATILKQSFPILDEVVRLLKVNPEITHLEIEGHTDNRGSDKLNEKLSADRAQSVMTYIVQHGIAADRLSSAGFGPKRPIADNGTAEGRQRNRRVEFHIQNQASAAPAPAKDAPKDPAP